MRYKIFNILEYITIISPIILFIWISFFPIPIQQRCYIFIKTFLGLAFLAVLLKKGAYIFKLSDLPLWFFLIAIFINILFAQHKNTAFKTYLDLALPMFFIYYFVAVDFSSESRFGLLVKTICISSSLVALGGILESWFAFNPIYKYFIKNPFYERYITGFVRPMSTQFNPAPLGSYLLASLPFNFLLFKQSRTFWRMLGAVGIVLNTAVLILTFSRCAFLGLVAMVIFYLLAQGKNILIPRFLIIVLFFVFISYFLPYPFDRFSTDYLVRGKGTAAFSDYRIDRYIVTGRMLNDHPLVGLGFQHFRIKFYDYYPHNRTVPYENMIADNMYLTILSEAGLIGFFGFFLFMFSLLRNAWRKLNMSAVEAPQRWPLLVSLMSTVGLLVNMGGYELFYWPNQYIYFCIVVGCITALSKT